MKKRPDIFFRHMLEAIEKIEIYVKGYDYDSFLEDNKTIDAVIRQFEIIGEAASRIPSRLTTDSPISWKAIVGMRNKLIHDYLGVDVGVVWKTINESFKVLKPYLKNKLRNG